MKPEKTLICVVGPTAIGKTALAIKVAKAFKTDIISADSRQFYKEMSIGTAVPSKEELQEATHHFIQSKSIQDHYSVGDFEKDALTLLNSLFEAHDIVVMAGGSGLYVDAVIKGLDHFPEVPAAYRQELLHDIETKGIETLQQELKKRDPEYFERVDLLNPHRLIRALEICRYSGKPYTSFLGNRASTRPFKTIYVGLTAEREVVYHRINRRVEQMMENGLLEEARQLYDQRELNALQTVGYRELFRYFDGDIGLDKAVEEIKKNTRRFAKRQFTWYRKNEDIKWFDFNTSADQIIHYLKEKSA